MNKTAYLFKLLFLEEFRVHKDMFNGYRFLGFPLVIFALVLGFSTAITQTNAIIFLDPSTVITGVQLLLVLFGIQTGSIVFINRDQFQNLLGDVTPIIYSSKILPRKQTSFMKLFIIKDIIYYIFLLILPISLGLLPFYSIIPFWTVSISFIGFFALGIGVSLLSISLYYKFTKPLLQIVSLLFSLSVIGYIYIGSIIGYTDVVVSLAEVSDGIYGFTVLGWIILLGILYLGSTIFTTRNSRSQTQYSSNVFLQKSRFNTVLSRIPITSSNLSIKQYIDISRSTGGSGKVMFSYILLSLIAFGALQFINPIVLGSSLPLYLGIVLSMSVFTVYMWINEADSFSEYAIHPISVQTIFESKFIIYLLYTLVPTSIIVIASGLYTQSYLETILSLYIICTLSIYTYGISTLFAGFNPREVLFDSIQFSKYSIATMVPLIPLLIASLFYTTFTTSVISIGLLIYTSILAIIGYKLYLYSCSYWSEKVIQVV